MSALKVEYPTEPAYRLNKCLEQGCGSSFKLKNELIDHLQLEHGIENKYSEQTFNSYNEFLSWLHKYENENDAQYFIRARRKRKDGSFTYYYECSRSGDSRSSDCTKRHSKFQGSIKIGTICTSHLVVKENKDTVRVKFWENHYNHKKDLKYLRISKIKRKEIAKKLAMGLTSNIILGTIRDSVSEGFKRDDLISRKDVHNIRRAHKIDLANNEGHIDDSNCLDVFIKQCQELGDKNPVAYYKKQGEASEELGSSDFCLIISNKGQQEMLEKFGNNVVCIDGTHGPHQYDFELTTLMVIDEFHEGFPVAFMISNRKDAYIFEILFKWVMNESGQICPTFLMTDLVDTYFDAWCTVMGPPGHRLFCLWHVTNTWTTNISNKVRVANKRKYIDNTLKTIQKITDEDSFKAMYIDFLQDLIDDCDTEEFGFYLQSNFSNNIDMWAQCYRSSSDINTDIHLERLHRTIKYEFLKGVRTQRLNNSIDILMKVVKNKEFERVSNLTRGEHHEHNSLFLKRHQAAAKMKDLIREDAANTWYIGKHVIVKLSDAAVACCAMKCVDCNVCIHNFSCTCLDFLSRPVVCKHIHYFIMNNIQDDNNETYEAIFENYEDISDNGETVEFIDVTDIENAELESTNIKIVKDTLIKDLENETTSIVNCCRQAGVEQIKQILQQVKATRVFVQTLSSSDDTLNLEETDYFQIGDSWALLVG